MTHNFSKATRAQRTFFVGFLAVCFLIICAGDAAATVSTKKLQHLEKAQDVDVLGRVFILKKDGNNIRLALVNVLAFPEQLFHGHLKTILDVDTKHLMQLRSQLAQARDVAMTQVKPQNLSFLVDEEAKADAVFRAASKAFKDSQDHQIYKKMVESAQIVTVARNKKDEVQQAYESEHAKRAARVASVRSSIKALLEATSRGSHYLQGLPSPSGRAKSDDEGKFTLTVPPGSYVLTAKAERLVGEQTESYIWMIRVGALKATQSTMLSNDNLFGLQCDECMQPEALPWSLSEILP